MGKASKNYLKMHHPSLYKKMYGKGGKVEKGYKKGGYVVDDWKDRMDKYNVGEFTYEPMPIRRKKVNLSKYSIFEESIKNTPAGKRLEKKKDDALKEAITDKKYKEGAVSEEPRYEGGGYVDKAEALSGMGDVVDAKLTPGEVVLNAKQLGNIEKITGMKTEALMGKAGVPGFQGGGKVDALKKYTPIGDESKLDWNFHKMNPEQRDSLVTAEEAHLKSIGLPGNITKAYEDYILQSTPESLERDRIGGYETHFAYTHAKNKERDKRNLKFRALRRN